MTSMTPPPASLRQQIDPIFYPRSIAVIGASANPKKTGNVLIQHLLDYQFPGSVYPINPEAGDILGVPVYRSVLDVPASIDLAIIVVGRAASEQAIQDCAQKGIKGAIVHTAGFGETGAEGKLAERRIVEIARSGGLRLIGPNCVGVLCPESRVPWTRRSELPVEAGAVGIISQTGGGAGSFVNLARQRGIAFSKVISVGNQCDLNVIDFLEYFSTDDSTKVVFLYLEAVDDGERFLRLARQVTPKKPIIVYKIGRTDVGRKASTSHTGSIASPIEIYDAAFRQAGILRARDVEEVIDYLIAFTRIVPRRGLPSSNRFGIITGPGGPGIAAADASAECGMLVPDLTPTSKQAIAEAVPSATRANPIDMADVSMVAYMREKDPYSALTQIVDGDENVDGIILVGPGEWDPESFAATLMKIDETCKKPFVAAWPASGDEVEACKKQLDQKGIPHFVTPERAARALASVVQYSQLAAKSMAGTHVSESSVDTQEAKKLIAHLKKNGRAVLTEHESKRILSLCRIQTTKEELATSAIDAMRIARAFGFPVALKIASPAITHKSDVGGVRLDLKSEIEVEIAYRDILHKVQNFEPDVPIDGVLVQEMLANKLELAVGAMRDAAFGPVVMFGLGGTYVEILRDVSFGITPLSRQDVDEMLRQVKAFPVLTGARGREPVNLTAIADLVLRISALMRCVDSIRELDLNPILADAKGVVVADARIVIEH